MTRGSPSRVLTLRVQRSLLLISHQRTYLTLEFVVSRKNLLYFLVSTESQNKMLVTVEYTYPMASTDKSTI